MSDAQLLNFAKKPAAPTSVSDTTTARFEQDVMAASMQTPVIVDFWAPWCGPCKQMLPLLEKSVAAENGQVRMVKVNIDENPELAQAFRIQSVPMVYAFFKGQPVDGFMGAKSESEIKTFIAKLKKLAGVKPADSRADQAALLAQAATLTKDSKWEDAAAAYSTALDHDMENPDALAGLGWCLYGMKETQGFDDLVTALSPESRKAAPLQGLLFLFARMAEGRAVSAAADLSLQLDAKPDNHQARFDLALRLLSTHDLEQALTQLITIVRKNRNWNEDKARQLVTDLLAAMGPHHPLTQSFRRQLSSVLFS